MCVLPSSIDDVGTLGVEVLAVGEFLCSGVRSIFTAVAEGRRCGYFRLQWWSECPRMSQYGQCYA